jgi:hypothetical protein
MANSPPVRGTAGRKAQSHFPATQSKESAFKQEIAREKAATVAKTARLRALRLAKEAVDKEARLRLAAETARLPPKTPRARSTRKKAPAAD